MYLEDEKYTHCHNKFIFCNNMQLQNLDWLFQSEQMTALRVRGGARKYTAGYQPDVVCLLTWNDNEHPGNITSVCTNSNYGLYVDLAVS